jgi:hypothetical protein
MIDIKILQKFVDKHSPFKLTVCMYENVANGMFIDILPREINVSESFFKSFSLRQVLSILAHEIAHYSEYELYKEKKHEHGIDILNKRDDINLEISHFNYSDCLHKNEYSADSKIKSFGGSNFHFLKALLNAVEEDIPSSPHIRRKIFLYEEIRWASYSHPSVRDRCKNLGYRVMFSKGVYKLKKKKPEMAHLINKLDQ